MQRALRRCWKPSFKDPFGPIFSFFYSQPTQPDIIIEQKVDFVLNALKVGIKLCRHIFELLLPDAVFLIKISDRPYSQEIGGNEQKKKPKRKLEDAEEDKRSHNRVGQCYVGVSALET